MICQKLIQDNIVVACNRLAIPKKLNLRYISQHVKRLQKSDDNMLYIAVIFFSDLVR